LVLCPNIILNSFIATIIVLEFSFFSLQQGEQKSAKVAELVASEYVLSQSSIIIKKDVEELLHQYNDEDRGDEKLCEMIIDMILQKRICESPLTP
jgi:hypothetical protein